MDPIIDIVIPYSREHTSPEMLRRAVNGVRRQSMDTRTLIISGVSPVAAARNKGLEKSGNRYVAFLDADDVFVQPDRLERQVEALEDEDAGICLGYSMADDGVNQIPYEHDQGLMRDIFLQHVSGFTSTVMVDTARVSERFDTDLYRLEDHLYALNCIGEAGAAVIEDPISRLYKHEDGLSANEDVDKKVWAHKQFFDKATDRWPFLNQYAEEYWWHVYHRCGREHYFHGNYDKSQDYLREALHHRKAPKTVAALAASMVRGL